jgi:hypothetical protein
MAGAASSRGYDSYPGLDASTWPVGRSAHRAARMSTLAAHDVEQQRSRNGEGLGFGDQAM